MRGSDSPLFFVFKYYIGEIFTDKDELMEYIKYLYKNNE